MFATLLYFAGVDILVAKEQPGHSNIKMTLEVYTHLDKQHKRTSMSTLDDFLLRRTRYRHRETSIMTYTEKMSQDVKSAFERCVEYISQMEGVQQIYLFGSYAYGEPRENSDIDMLVIVEDGINTLKTMQKISLDLCDIEIGIDVIADTDSDFRERSAPDRFTLQRDIKDNGVLIYG